MRIRRHQQAPTPVRRSITAAAGDGALRGTGMGVIVLIVFVVIVPLDSIDGLLGLLLALCTVPALALVGAIVGAGNAQTHNTAITQQSAITAPHPVSEVSRNRAPDQKTPTCPWL